LEVAGPFTIYWVLPHFFKNMTEKRNISLLILFQAILVYGAIIMYALGIPLGLGLI